MSNMPEIYPEILDPKRQTVFTKLKAFNQNGYLAGGTALALQIKHRKSYDFDIFLFNPITDQFRKKVRKIFSSNIEPRINTGDLFLVKLSNNIEVHFVYYWFERLEDEIKTDSISLASVKDIAADKAHTIGRRATWRDYVDIFYLLKNKVLGLEEIIKLAEKKFRGDFASHLFLKQLTYFEDFKVEPIDFLQEEYSPEKIEEFLIEEAERYTQKQLSN